MPLIVNKEKYVVTARVNRPESRNAVNFELMSKLEELLDQLENDNETRLFILTGTGDSFISGGDLREFHGMDKADDAKIMTGRMLNILERIEKLPFWTLAVINGYAYGGGWETMLVFDFRVAVKDAKIGFTQGKFYLPPGWGGIQRLKNSVNLSLAMFWLASQKVISALEAKEAGIIHDVFNNEDLQSKTDQLKKNLTLNDKTFIKYLKQSLRSENQLDEIEPFSQFWESSEHIERVEKFLKKK